MHKSQNQIEIKSWNIKARATLRWWRCLHSAIPFCWGVAVQLLWYMMPKEWKNPKHEEFNNSVPLSLQTILLNYFEHYQEMSNVMNYLTFAFHQQNPVIRSVVINNDKNKLFTSEVGVLYGPYINMNQFEKNYNSKDTNEKNKSRLFCQWTNITISYNKLFIQCLRP